MTAEPEPLPRRRDTRVAFWLWDKVEEAEDTERYKRETRSKLARVVQQLALYRSAGWGLFQSELEAIEAAEKERLVSTDDISASRERIKLVRHLLGREERLEAERAELEEALRSSNVIEEE